MMTINNYYNQKGMTNKPKLLLLTILGLITLIACTDKKNEIEFIKLQIEHSRRIPDATVIIEITKKDNEIMVHYISTPKEDSQDWKQTKRDTTFLIEKKIFKEISRALINLKKSDFSKAEIHGKDGIECSLKFGTVNNTIDYSFWSPDIETENRGLTEYLKVCKQLIETVNLKPDYIL